MEKKKWSVEKVTKLVVLIAAVLVIVAAVGSMIFPNPIGANVRLITRLICGGTIVTAIFILAMWIYRAKKNKRMLKIFSGLLCIMLVIVVALNVVVASFYVMVNQFLHRNTTPAEQVVKETEAAREVTEQLEAEGLVLLRNEKNTLPLSGGKVNVFGFASDAIVYGGSGSGAADESKNVNLKQALESAGLEVNEELAEFYKKKTTKQKKATELLLYWRITALKSQQ